MGADGKRAFLSLLGRDTMTMKRAVPVLFAVCLLSLGLTFQGLASEAGPDVFGKGTVVQIGVVVNDIEKAGQAYADFLGVAAPEWSWTDAQDKAHTQFKGLPSPARAKLAFIKLRNITLELIEPDRNPSTWREFLDTRGQGIHHIAFEVKGMDEKTALLAKKGLPLLQKGDYEGGRYAYIDGTVGLGLILELLENF